MLDIFNENDNSESILLVNMVNVDTIVNQIFEPIIGRVFLDYPDIIYILINLVGF